MADELDVSTDEGYAAAMELVSAWVRAGRALPVAELLEQLGRVETLAPILDPTAYWRHGDRLAEQRRVLEAVRRVQVVADEIAGPVGAEAP